MSRPSLSLGLWLTAVAGLGTVDARGESRTFPYSASVRTSEVEVRSGPGQRYYVTGRVRLNERVTVHRHDPGGWYMISPPPGSFSYIDASLVRRTGDTEGVVEAPAFDSTDAARPIVRIGSELSDDHTYYGRELANGDSVQILGEKLLNTDRGAVRMYRIAPPPLEYRWVKGDFIVADGETKPATATAERGPTVPAVSPAPAVVSSGATDPFASPHRPATTTTAPATQSSPVASAAKDALVELDLRYLELIQQRPDQWDLDGLVADYQALQLYAAPEQREQIAERLAALESRRAIWNQFQEFEKLTSATAQRDAELAAMQSGIQLLSGEAPEGSSSAVTPALATTPKTVPGAMTGQPQLPPAGTPGAPAVPAQPQLAGAGIVQQMPTGRPGQFVLVLADARGRVLATLNAPPQMGLERYVGQSLGVVGQRYFEPRLRSDVINVQQILPVQLAP